MPDVHLNGQLRVCGAHTVVQEQSSVTVDGELWAVHGDPNSHGAGLLITSTFDITIEGKGIIAHKPDLATMDNLLHDPALTQTAEGYAGVTVY